jgi:hypothetical protein
MQSAPWLELLRKLPAEVHQQLVLTTEGGVEFAVQSILLMEGECLVFKGRVSGSQDAGRLFFVPFDHIDYVGFNRTVSEEEFKSWYGAAEPPPMVAPQQDVFATSPRSPIANRAALLEKIRARTSSPGI